MHSRKRRNQADLAKLEMTPMIDVVFQLLIFFIVSLNERDILSNLVISRPSTQDTQIHKPTGFLTIQIDRNGWVLNSRPLVGPQAHQQLSRQLARLASFNPNISVIIKCTNDAPHSKHIQTLNICARENMSNIAVLSL